MRTLLPKYSHTIDPLDNQMENIYKKAGRRTKKAVNIVALSGEWEKEEDSAFQKIEDQLTASTKTSNPKPYQIMYLFTDASDAHCASIFTQIKN